MLLSRRSILSSLSEITASESFRGLGYTFSPSCILDIVIRVLLQSQNEDFNHGPVWDHDSIHLRRKHSL